MHGIAFKYLLDAKPDVARGGEWDNIDRKVLVAAQAAEHVAAPGRLSRLAGWLSRLVQARKEKQHLSAAVMRLQETAPHLLDDIGLPVVAETVAAPDHAAHLAQDIALPAEDARPAARPAMVLRPVAGRGQAAAAPSLPMAAE